tara:strand:- start:101 stop:277 length:177 start_codon:yes stop_codon:yes gene_type:complete
MKKSSLSDQIIGAVVILLAFPLILMLIWNAVIPGIFGLPTLGYWSAMGLYIVCSLLFK